MFALLFALQTEARCGNYASAKAQLDELLALADEKNAQFWKTLGATHQGCVLALTGKAAEAIATIKPGLAAIQSMRVSNTVPYYLSALAHAHAELSQFNEARRCLDEAMSITETTKERWFEAEVNRIAGEIALRSERDTTKAVGYFERALAVARQQQARSWELRAAMSMARLWRDQGKRDEARDLIAPVYGWFTEGFDTLDLKEAKALLDELAA
jgi:predicted ATPase